MQYWKDLENAAIEAVENPGKQISAGITGLIAYKKVGSFLFCKLPGPRVLTYPYPKLVPKKMPWTDGNGAAVFKQALTYMGTKGQNRSWRRQDFYGGLADENVTQAVSRDVMMYGQRQVYGAGLPIILKVHDEIITEVPAASADEKAFNRLITMTPPWAAGLPLAAASDAAVRYKK